MGRGKHPTKRLHHQKPRATGAQFCQSHDRSFRFHSPAWGLRGRRERATAADNEDIVYLKTDSLSERKCADLALVRDHPNATPLHPDPSNFDQPDTRERAGGPAHGASSQSVGSVRWCDVAETTPTLTKWNQILDVFF